MSSRGRSQQRPESPVVPRRWPERIVPQSFYKGKKRKHCDKKIQCWKDTWRTYFSSLLFLETRRLRPRLVIDGYTDFKHRVWKPLLCPNAKCGGRGFPSLKEVSVDPSSLSPSLPLYIPLHLIPTAVSNVWFRASSLTSLSLFHYLYNRDNNFCIMFNGSKKWCHVCIGPCFCLVHWRFSINMCHLNEWICPSSPLKNKVPLPK